MRPEVCTEVASLTGDFFILTLVTTMCFLAAVFGVHGGALAFFPVGLRRPYPGRGQDSSHEMQKAG